MGDTNATEPKQILSLHDRAMAFYGASFAGGANDTYQNVLGRLGAGMPNIQEATQYVLTRFTRDYNQLNALYRNSWLSRKIIDTIPKDMIKNGWRWQADIEPSEIDLMDKTQRETRLRAQLLDGLKWGRLYGGAAGLIMLEGQDDLEEPINYDSIMVGDYKGIIVVDRWNGADPSSDLVDDIDSLDFGYPEFYTFRNPTDKSKPYKVHHSRILRFEGDDLPYWEKQAENMWSASKLEAVYEDLRRRDSTGYNIAGLIFLANLRILKMSDLGELLSGTAQKAQEALVQTLSAQNQLMSNFGVQLLSKEDDFQSIQLSNFAGINEVYQSFMMDLSGATGIPVTKLFGRSPAGMNATGESDLKNYYEMLEHEQENVLCPLLDKLQPILLMSTYGEIVDGMEYEFEPVATPEEDEIADLVKNKTEAIMSVHDRGIISDRTALLELQAISKGTGMYTNITDEDIQKADDEPRDEGIDLLSGNTGGNGPDDDVQQPDRPSETDS